MKLSTERLVLETFSIELIDAAIGSDYSKIKSLGYESSSDWPDEDLLEALPFFKNLIQENGTDGFNSWIILSRETSEVLGSLGFIGCPDSEGNVELGFGIIPGKRNNGYCYESVICLIDWAFSNKLVQNILAKCENSNTQSISVLKKTGFTIIGEEEGLLVWGLHK